MVVRAPVDGIVQELAVTAPGQSVGSNQPLMKLVPTGGGLVIEARVANQDIGYVRVGQPATVKVRAFDFLRYGTLEGRIERIAADATADPRERHLPYASSCAPTGRDLGTGDNRLASCRAWWSTSTCWSASAPSCPISPTGSSACARTRSAKAEATGRVDGRAGGRSCRPP